MQNRRYSMRAMNVRWTAALFAAAAMLNTSTAHAAASPPQSRFNLLAIYDRIAKSEYHIGWQPDVGAYQAPNRAHNLRITFDSAGLTAVCRNPVDPGDNWKVTFALVSYGEQNPFNTGVINPTPQINENTANFSTDEIVFDYTNDTNGLHQSFLIKRKPLVGKLNLRIDVALTGLGMGLSQAADYVYFFEDITGEEVLRYEGLHVFDATGRELPARFDLSQPNTLSMLVDDTNAQYPVLVDPWLLAHTLFGSQTGAHLGYSLAFIDVLRSDIPPPPGCQGNQYWGSLAVGAPWF